MDNKEMVIIKIMGDISEVVDIDSRKLRAILDEALNGCRIEKETYELVASDLQEKIAYFLASKKIDSVKSNTLYNYNLKLQHFANTVVKPVQMITTHDIRYYLAILAKTKNLKESSMISTMSVLKSFFSWLCNEEIIERDPMKKIKTPSINKKDLRKALTPEELEKVKNSCGDLREKALVEFLASSGCRISEVQQLNIDDLDMHERSVTVLGKGDKKRTVYFSARAKLFISEYLESRKDKTPALFVSQRNPHGRLGVRGLQLIVKKLGEEAGIKSAIHPHLLRHTFATLAINAGMDITVIQSLLGHESVATTQIYATMNKDHIKSEYRKLRS